MKRIVKIGAVTYAQLIKHMLEGELSCQELADITGLHYITVLQYTRELYRAGAAHVVRYDPDARGRRSVRVYKIGVGKDAKRTPLPPAQRQKVSRQRKNNARLLGLLREPARQAA